MKSEYLILTLLLVPELVLSNAIPCMTAEEIPEVCEMQEIPAETKEKEVAIEQEIVEYEATPIEATVYEIASYPGTKKWMDYRCFSNGTAQELLQQYAVTDSFGLRQVNGSYCVAIGSRFNAEIGQRFDLILENGVLIPCVMGDMKADIHTDATNTFTNVNKNLCCSEFIVSEDDIPSAVSKRGDTSFVSDIWQSPVARIVVYNINILEELKEVGT